MMSRKTILAAVVAAPFGVHYAAAETLTASDAAFAFGSGQPVAARPLAPLSADEMIATEGRMVIGGARGAVSKRAGNAGNARRRTDKRSRNGIGRALRSIGNGLSAISRKQ